MAIFDWNFSGAEREYWRAVELKPSYVEAYCAIASLLLHERRFDEATAEIRKVLDLDPVSEVAASYAGTIFLYAGYNQEAIEMYTRALEMDPTSAFNIGNRGLARVRAGMVAEGVKELASVADIRVPSFMNDLAYAYARAGMTKELKRLLEELLKEARCKPELAIAVASAYANLGNTQKAIKWLEKAYDSRLAYLPEANSDFVFDAIRSNPRFKSLMRRMGFENVG